MLVELIEVLRCPRPHDESALVLAPSRTDARVVTDGTLGCPVCGAEFDIVDGVARFDEPATEHRGEQPDDETAIRLAALLQLADARGIAVLCGRFASQAAAVARLVSVRLVLVNAAADAPSRAAAASLLVGATLPFAASSLLSAAIDEGVQPPLARSIVRSLRHRGRVAGPAGTAIPDGLLEIARDERMWLGEKNSAAEPASPRPVSLTRARR